MPTKVKVSTCNLNQWALDFEGNYKRILESIVIAREQNSKYRVGPELEICGYGCQDHYYEPDTFLHSWQVLVKLVTHPECRGILCDVGMPVMHNSVAYNCRVYFLNGRILLIRPKLTLADDDNYRESRYFTAWTRQKQVEDHLLPTDVRAKLFNLHPGRVPFGDACIECEMSGVTIGSECCEELWSPQATHLSLALDGVDIISNASGSHHQLRKANRRVGLIQQATSKCGGVYLFANQRGCDGDRLYFDGTASICVNGAFVAQGEQFSVREIEVITSVCDVDDVRAYRGRIRTMQRQGEAQAASRYPRIRTTNSNFDTDNENDFSLCCDENEACATPIEWRYPSAMEEIERGPACWLWDYLRRSKQSGFFLPLSGGIDSCSTACIVFSMCRIVYAEIKDNNQNKQSQQVLEDLRGIIRRTDEFFPESAEHICNMLFTTCYMGTENSSSETRDRAKLLATKIGANHLSIVIDVAVRAVLSVWTMTMGPSKTPKYKMNGGSHVESISLQNIQARLRMVLSYFFAQLTLWSRGQGQGSLLVLGSANVDESLRGYFTKYDCSSADLNPIGSICKRDLRSFVLHCADTFSEGQPEADKFDVLRSIHSAPPTAELEPLRADGQIGQLDEVDMGMSYDELTVFGKLRKQENCGPCGMFSKLCDLWSRKLTPSEIAVKVKHFFVSYAINRHKMTTITPAYFAETYSPDDNRFDHRQFLYPADFTWQFRQIDASQKQMTANLATSMSMGLANDDMFNAMTQSTSNNNFQH